MRPLVSLVEARPETIVEDYRRALALAGLDRAPAVGPWSLAVSLDGARWQPGRTAPPWQVAGVLAALRAAGAAAGPLVTAVGAAGPLPWPTGAPWDHLPGTGAVRDACAVRGAPVPFRTRERCASLEATGAVGSVPFALRHQPVLAVAAADLVSPWQIEGACATLGRLVLGGHPSRRGVPPAEVRAETVALLREAFPALGGVVDGTLWHVGPRGRALARHVIIAGDDPLAVDAVALRLAGMRPREVPWLGACARLGLGAVEPEDMHLRGHVHLLDLDFALPDPVVARPVGAALLARLRLPQPRWIRREAAPSGLGPWAALHAEMAAGGSADRG